MSGFVQTGEQYKRTVQDLQENRILSITRAQSKAQLHNTSAAPRAPSIERSLPPNTRMVRFSWRVSNDPLCTVYNVYRGAVDKSEVAERVDVVPQSPDRSRGLITWEDPFPNANKQFYWVAAANAVGIESPRVACKTNFIPGTANFLCPYDVPVSTTSFTPDLTLGNWFRWAISANSTLNNPINPACAGAFMVQFKITGAGNWTMTYGSQYKFGLEVPNGNITTTSGLSDFGGFLYDERVTKWACVAFVREYSL